MPSQKLDLQVDQDADFSEDFVAADPVTGSPTDFTGAAARLMLRVNPSDPVPLASISTTPNASGSISLTTGDPGASPPTPSSINVTLTKAATGSLTMAKCFYELMIDWADGTTTALMAGNVFINPAVTY